MGIRIDALDATATPTRDHELPAMDGGVTVKLSVAQIIGLIEAEDVEAGIAAAPSDNDLADTDEVAYLTGTTLKRGTLTGFIASVFKTARTIANAQFASATFKLFNAAGTPRALSFDTTALTADRTITVPDANITLSVPVFTKSFVSAEQTITAAGTLSLAHGLAEPPRLMEPVLICKTAENGYSVNDIIPANLSVSSSATDNFGASFEISGSTNIVIRFGSNAVASFLALNKTTGASVALTNANWRLIVRAYA